MSYEKPAVIDLGSIADHTWTLPGGNVKGGGDIVHLDRHCEFSGCTSATDPDCVDKCE